MRECVNVIKACAREWTFRIHGHTAQSHAFKRKIACACDCVRACVCVCVNDTPVLSLAA